MAALALLRLGKLTGRADFLTAAERTLNVASGLMRHAPRATGQMLLALDMYLGPTKEIVIVGDPATADTAEVLSRLRKAFAPNKLLACRTRDRVAQGSPALAPLFAGKDGPGPEPAVYVCEQFACQAPVYGREAGLKVLEFSL